MMGEEGLGDLRGCGGLDTLGPPVRATIGLEGHGSGHINHTAGPGALTAFRPEPRAGIAGCRRGGRQPFTPWCVWAANHDLCAAPDAQDHLNIGPIEARHLHQHHRPRGQIDLDLRSEAPSLLDDVAARVEALARPVTRRGPGGSPHHRDRPAGSLPRATPCAFGGFAHWDAAGVSGFTYEAGSRMPHPPQPRFCPVVCIGLTAARTRTAG